MSSPPQRIDADLATVRRQFDRRAARFARHDTLVREVGSRLLERLELMRLAPRRILDLGCGAAPQRAPLLRRYPEAQWVGVDLSPGMLRAGATPAGVLGRLAQRIGLRPGDAARVCASAERLPFADGSFDLVYSNLMLHWHPAPHEVIGETARVLRTGGLLVFSSYGPDTLLELRGALRAAGLDARPLPSVDMHDFGDMMMAAGFENPVMEAETLRLTYGDARQLLDEARALGGNPRRDRARGLPGGHRARTLLAALRGQAGADGRIGLRFEIAIGHGWKAPAREAGVSTVAMPRSRRG